MLLTNISTISFHPMRDPLPPARAQKNNTALPFYLKVAIANTELQIFEELIVVHDVLGLCVSPSSMAL